MDLAKLWEVLERYGGETIVIVALIGAAAYVLANAIPAYFRYRSTDRDSKRRYDVQSKALRSKIAERRSRERRRAETPQRDAKDKNS